MSYGMKVNGELFGFFGLEDWLVSIFYSFPAPWNVAPLEGKYYGTHIVDARNVAVLNVWHSHGEPSEREKRAFGLWTPEAWGECCSDNHWESEDALALANITVAMRNTTTPAKPIFDERRHQHIVAILTHPAIGWAEAVWPEVRCGGPERRPLDTDEDFTGAWVSFGRSS